MFDKKAINNFFLVPASNEHVLIHLAPQAFLREVDAEVCWENSFAAKKLVPFGFYQSKLTSLKFTLLIISPVSSRRIQ